MIVLINIKFNLSTLLKVTLILFSYDISHALDIDYTLNVNIDHILSVGHTTNINDSYILSVDYTLRDNIGHTVGTDIDYTLNFDYTQCSSKILLEITLVIFLGGIPLVISSLLTVLSVLILIILLDVTKVMLIIFLRTTLITSYSYF